MTFQRNLAEIKQLALLLENKVILLEDKFDEETQKECIALIDALYTKKPIIMALKVSDSSISPEISPQEEMSFLRDQIHREFQTLGLTKMYRIPQNSSLVNNNLILVVRKKKGWFGKGQIAFEMVRSLSDNSLKEVIWHNEVVEQDDLNSVKGTVSKKGYSIKEN